MDGVVVWSFKMDVVGMGWLVDGGGQMIEDRVVDGRSIWETGRLTGVRRVRGSRVAWQGRMLAFVVVVVVVVWWWC